MGYSVYYNGEIDISPELSDEHATLLDEALTKSNLALLGITAEDGQGLYHGCDWQLSGGRLTVEGESRGEQDEWLRLLIVRFFEPNGYTLSGEVSWEGDQSGDTGVIHLDDNRVESVSDGITNAGPSWRPQLPEPKVLELVRAGRIVLAHWESGDLAAQIRRLSRALEEFVQPPDEGRGGWWPNLMPRAASRDRSVTGMGAMCTTGDRRVDQVPRRALPPRRF